MSIIERAVGQVKAAATSRVVAKDRPASSPLSFRSPSVHVDANALAAAGLRPTDESMPRHRSEYRAIRKIVLAAAFSQPPSSKCPHAGTVAVVSALSGEGKTFTALNLALTIAAEKVRNVLLVDADLYRRQLSKALGIHERPGLSDILEDSSIDVTEVGIPTSIEGLSFLSAGTRTSHLEEILVTGRVQAVFGSLARVAGDHVVVIDTAPLIQTTDTPVISDAVSQVLLVVRAGVTLQDVVVQAISKLDPSVPVGIVLNAWQPTLVHERKYHNSYYGYGDGAGAKGAGPA